MEYDDAVKFFDPYSTIHVTGNRLPHWQQPGATYFITFRLGDSLPASTLKAWREEREAWLRSRPTPLPPDDEAEYHRLFSTRFDEFLDSGHGSCLLEVRQNREVLETAFRFFEGERYAMISWVIMPNHVHVCAMLSPDWALEKVVFTWKRRTAGEINRLKGISGPIWMADYFDRLVRDESHFRNVVRYIRRNPVMAGLPASRYALWESDVARAVE